MGSLRHFVPLILVIVLFAGNAASQGRNLLQRGQRPRRKGAERSILQDGVPKATLFNFRPLGGAKKVLSRLDPAILAKVMRRTEKDLDRLSQQLDEDPDFGVDTVNGGILFACAGIATALELRNKSLPRTSPSPQPQPAEDPTQDGDSLLLLNPGSLVSSPIPEADTSPDPASFIDAPDYTPVAPEPDKSVGGQAPRAAPDPDYLLAFNLSSRPAATKKIWLDFKGCNITNSVWNTNGNIINNPPYDRDNAPATFNRDEMSDIVVIWRAVVEDFSPFDVDVTTIPPPASFNASFMCRVCIGGTAGPGFWYPDDVGGLAFVGYFGTLENTFRSPAWVFAKNLADTAKNIWEAVSHEIGHTMGLSHDGQTRVDEFGVIYTQTYYLGHSGPYSSWAPIMGLAYGQDTSQWSNGEYENANNWEDDIAILESKLGRIPATTNEIPQDSSLMKTSVSQSTGRSTASVSSVMSRPNKYEYYVFYAARGPLTFTAQVMSDWTDTGIQRANLNLLLKFVSLGSSGTEAIYSPRETLGVGPITVNIATEGFYYLGVAGSPAGNPYDSGFSSYASLGSYSLTAVYATPASIPAWIPPPSISNPNPTALLTASLDLAYAKSTTVNSKSFTCRAIITVTLNSFENGVLTNTLMPGALVTGTWSVVNGTMNRFPYAALAKTANKGGELGIAKSTSQKINGINQGCRFTITQLEVPAQSLKREVLVMQALSLV